MFLIITSNDGIIYKDLDKNPYCYKGIRVSFNINYYLEVNDSFNIKGYDKKKIILENKHYEISCEDLFYTINIFVYENSIGINKYCLYTYCDFHITNSLKSNIINHDEYLNNQYFVLKNNVIKTNSDYLYVNNKKVIEKTLMVGDHIQFLGFSMFFYQDFLYINEFLNDNRLNKKQILEKRPVYKKNLLKLNQRFSEPVLNLEIEELKKCELPKVKNQKSLIMQIGPSLTMSFTMFAISIINVYNNKLNGGNSLSSLIFVMMPLTMLISGVIWPLINLRSENKTFSNNYDLVKNNYLVYLKNYKNRQLTKIKNYKDRLSQDILDLNDFYSRLFTYNKNNYSFLKVFIGYKDIFNGYVIDKTGDEDIDKELIEIEEVINKISNVPLYLDINKINNLTIITNKNYKDYYFNLYLLELSYKHHYDDLIIAIYKKEMKRQYNLPHMFINNTRYSLNNERQLQELSSLKTDKQIILFLYDKPQFIIKNQSIKCIYVSNNENDILIGSDTIIKYCSSCGYLINTEKIKFNYFNKDYDFNHYFNLIERFQNVNLIPKIYTYKNKDKDYLLKENYCSKQISLKADFAYVGDELLSFDLHETKQGPHGLIGGTTGSGKSELLISFILSLCIKYRPDYINIVLIDYKGEGIKDSLSSNSIVIPHIVANISNLEEDAFERLIIKIRNECKKRQLLFNHLSSLTSLSIVNIDNYMENNNNKLENIAHLIIIVDEFAELKKEYPELMKELVSLSRIGRSLGVHLILSTQRPSGVIDDEIWSNSHFKIALKVNNEKDSQDLIKTKEAAYLTKAGEFYLQVDDSLIKAKSIYSKNDISGKEKIEVSVLDNCLNIDKKIVINNPNPIIESNYIANKIIETCKELDINKKTLDFEKPNSKTIEELNKEYKVKNNEIILGEIDDYINGISNVLEVNNKENILIYSTRNKEINTIINSLIHDSRKMIIISNIKYSHPLIIDSLLYEDIEDINYLFSKLLTYKQEVITLIIEDYSCFVSYNDIYQEKVCKLLQRKDTTSINSIILSKKSTFSFKLLNYINKRYVIKILDNQDLLNIYCCQSKYKGDSFYQDENLIPFVPVSINEFINEEQSKETFIKKIPLKLEYSYDDNKLLIGFSKRNRSEIYINDNEKLLVLSMSQNIIEIFSELYSKNKNVIVKQYEHHMDTKEYRHIIWLGKNKDKQTLFYDDNKTRLLDNEGIYLRDGQKEIIRVINYE